MLLFQRLCMGWLLLVGLGILIPPGPTGAQAPGKKDKKGEVNKPVKWDEKKIAFEMRTMPWVKVFAWFCDHVDMPYVAKVPPPPGNFTFINPRDEKGKAREYTLTEIHVIVNEVLIEQTKHVLVRREKTLTLLPLK